MGYIFMCVVYITMLTDDSHNEGLLVSNELEGNDHDLIKVLSQHLPEGPEESHEKEKRILLGYPVSQLRFKPIISQI
jgi:hypothetical protein